MLIGVIGVIGVYQGSSAASAPRFPQADFRAAHGVAHSQNGRLDDYVNLPAPFECRAPTTAIVGNLMSTEFGPAHGQIVLSLVPTIGWVRKIVSSISRGCG